MEKIVHVLRNEGFTNSNQILKVVKTRKKVQPILERHNEISRYLLGFMRKIRSLQPQKHSFKKLPDQIIIDTLVEKLKTVNIRNIFDLLDRTASRKAGENLKQNLDVDLETLQTLIKYADLMRLMYIGKILAIKIREFY